MKKIAVVTGSRAEYGNIYLLLKKIQESKDLDLLFYVTGMHLLEKYGNTIELIKKDSVPIHKIIPMYPKEDISSAETLGNAIGLAIQGFTNAFYDDKPDLLLIPGDRFEIFSAVIAAASLDIPVAHIQGGDSAESSQVDERIRHSISKFAHLHFPACKSSAERLKKMGEEEWRIHNVGGVSLDQIYEMQLYDKKMIFKKLGLNVDEITVLCIYHPYIPDAEEAGNQMEAILTALKNLNLQTIIIYPNNDLGSDKIIQVIESYRGVEIFKIFKNIPRLDYLSLLKNVDLFVGNSSSGIVEAPTFKLPFLNIGPRNKGRETGSNIINLTTINVKKIKFEINRAISDEFKIKCQKTINPYGNGKASEKIVKILEDLKIDKKFLSKVLTY
ncbi:MAG: UDP-N-acetylglucosamine 2-epimerase [Candidatus Odinarchaeota archaeon]